MKRLLVGVFAGLVVGVFLTTISYMHGTTQARGDVVCPVAGFHYTPKTIGELYGRFLQERVGKDGTPDDGTLLQTTYDVLGCVHGN